MQEKRVFEQTVPGWHHWLFVLGLRGRAEAANTRWAGVAQEILSQEAFHTGAVVVRGSAEKRGIVGVRRAALGSMQPLCVRECAW